MRAVRVLRVVRFRGLSRIVKDRRKLPRIVEEELEKDDEEGGTTRRRRRCEWCEWCFSVPR